MIQYKLISEHPGSPKLGTIDWFKTDELGGSSSKNWLGTNFYDANPKFWQKVEEKVEELDYDILNYTDHNGFLFHSFSNGYSINSVKRLSDGEVFTIGDEATINDETRRYKIIAFNKRNEKIQVHGKSESREFFYRFDSVKKLPKKTPLFTTEDGVNIFKGNKFFYPNTHVWRVNNTEADKEIFEFVVLLNKYKTFSTKEKAEEYILFNKPLLSLNDLISNWGDVSLHFFKSSSFFNRLLEFAKSKL